MSFSESPLKEQIFKNLKMVRTFHPVGQGAFYTERFYEGDKNVFNMVYDCGSSTKGQYLKMKLMMHLRTAQEKQRLTSFLFRISIMIM